MGVASGSDKSTTLRPNNVAVARAAEAAEARFSSEVYYPRALFIARAASTLGMRGRRH